MCIDLYVDKLLVYSNCLTPSPVPSPMRVDNIIVTNTSPTPGNYSIPYDTPLTPLPDNTLAIAIVMACAIIPCIIWMICACVKCRQEKKVQPKPPKKKCCAKEKTLPTRGTQTPQGERVTRTN